MKKELYNIFENIKFSKEKEIEEIIYEDEALKIIRTMSLNQKTNYYDQDDLEIVFLLSGSASIEFKSSKEIVKLEKGDMYEIKPHEIHRVIEQDKAIWLCIFRREDF